MRGRASWLLGVCVALGAAAAGCPLTIEIRCEADAECPVGEACATGRCEPQPPGSADASTPRDGGVADAGGDRDGGHDGGGADAGADSGVDAGVVVVDAGCDPSVALDQPCQRACECQAPGAICQSVCALPCATDFTCPSGRRCEDGACRPGPRLGEDCVDTFECPTYAMCDLDRKWCRQICANDFGCEPGYRCAPDQVCIEKCEEIPQTLGLTCESSMDCGRCGYCVQDGAGTLRCHQRCQLDRDCPDGGAGACEDRFNYRVCRL